MFKVAIVTTVACVVLFFNYESVLNASALPIRELAPFMIDLALSTPGDRLGEVPWTVLQQLA